MKEPEDALTAGLLIAKALEEASVPYALGGALAFGQYGIPRATNDVDVNVFVAPEELPRVFAALRTLDIAVDDSAAFEKPAKRASSSFASAPIGSTSSHRASSSRGKRHERACDTP